MGQCQCYQGLIVAPILTHSRSTVEESDIDLLVEGDTVILKLGALGLTTHADFFKDSNEEPQLEEKEPQSEEECEPNVGHHDSRVEYLFELASKRWNFHPFVVDILRKVSNYIVFNIYIFNSLDAPQFNVRDPIPEGPKGIQLLDDLAVMYDAVSISLLDIAGL
jgi:hypothetical protein